MTIQSVQADVAWRPRPVLSAGVRLLAYATPIAAGTLVVRLVAPTLTADLGRVPAAMTAVFIAVVVSLLVSRLSLRLLPLVVLLRMTMLFPDKAPSRIKVARQATSMREITRLLASRDLTEHEAAETMLALVTALGRHDRRTRGHSERVRLFCDLLSRELDLPAADAGRLRWAALIHDVGKLEVAASVLNKPGSLTAQEWRQVQRHPEAGAALAAPLARWLGPWFAGIAEHHERYDGTGYPHGLAGAQISLAGRAVAVVDAFETMTAARSYKAVRSTFSARAELTRCAGTHFDPAMVRAFLQIALPRLLWSVGPLAFVVNVPFLRWLGEGGARVVDAAAATTVTATGAAGMTAVAVAVGALPTAAASTNAPHRPPAAVKVFATRADQGTPRSASVSAGRDGGRAGGSVGGVGSGSGSGAGSGAGAGGSTAGGAASSAGTTLRGTVDTTAGTVGTTVDTVGSTVGSVGSTVTKTAGGLTSGLGLSSPSPSPSSSSSSSAPTSGSGSGSSGSSGSGSGGLGGALVDTVCTLPVGLCPDPSHTH